MSNPRSERLHPLEKPSLLRFPAPKPASARIAVRERETGSGEALFLESLRVIDDVTGQICRRHHVYGADADDFQSEVRLHFIDNNYEVLRRFEGRSSLPTYVTVVIQRLFLDYRNLQWGRWRPSAAAKRLGPTAILLERLISRDGWSLDQAAELLRTNCGIELDDSLQALCIDMAKRRPGRQFVEEEHAADIPTVAPPTDAKLVRAEQSFFAKRLQAALDRARQALRPEDQLVLKMRFEDGVSVANIARALHLDQKRLYRTLERLLARVGAELEAEGISRADVSALLFADVLDRDRDEDSDAGGGAAARQK